MKRVCSLAIVLLLAAIAGRASAQEFRGSISGRVTDTSKGLLPGATVTVTNIATNVATSTTTNGEGDYTILYLTPGTYTLSVELAGFKKMVRDGVEVRVGDKLAVDATLDVGRVEETVSVTAESPLLETRGGSAGQVIGEKQISLMPLSDGNPFALTRLVPGVALQAIGQAQSGFPIDFGNLYYNGDPTTLKVHYSNNTDVPVFDTSGFYFHDAAVQTNGVDDPVKQRADQRYKLASNIRYFPSRIEGIRGPVLKTWDISLVKQVRIAGSVRAQFNIECLNAFNQAYFNNANTDPTSVNFGKVTSQNNLPREIQLAAKFVF